MLPNYSHIAGQRMRAWLRLDELALDRLEAPAAARLRREQIHSAIEQTSSMQAGSLVFGPLLVSMAWNNGVNSLLILWLCGYWGVFAGQWWAWRALRITQGSEQDLNRLVHWIAVPACVVGIGFAVIYPNAHPQAKSALQAIYIGIAAFGTMSLLQAPRAAYWFLAIQMFSLAIVCVIVGAASGNIVDTVFGIACLFAAATIAHIILERQATQLQAFVNVEELNQKTEVIDLLLKDYETQGVEWIWRTDKTGKILSLPQPIEQMLLGFDGAEHHGDLLPFLRSHTTELSCEALRSLRRAFKKRIEIEGVTLPIKARSGQKWILIRGRPQFNGMEFTGYRGIFADATATVEAQREAQFLAQHDGLTKLVNRHYVQRHLAGLDPEIDEVCAYAIDLDAFKQVNDSYGQEVGDELLKCLATRLQNICQPCDVVARLGSDEFLLLLPKRGQRELSHEGFVDRVLAELSAPVRIQQYDIAVSASIGTAVFPGDTKQGPDILKKADIALFEAKQRGKNICVPYTHALHAEHENRLLLADRLRLALERGEVEPYFQPLYSAQSGTITGFELLARWQDPVLGFVSPERFVAVAEETGLIHQLGRDLLSRACRIAQGWPSPAGGAPLSLFVNVSPVQIMRGNVIDVISQVLEETGFPPERLEIEVTEGVLIHDLSSTIETLRCISDLGVGIALDDFGTGYSSLNYIRALPLDRLKIDRSFVSEIHSQEGRSVVEMIVELSHRLNLQVIAEGVETAQQAEVLGALGCDYLQGYFFSKPMPCDNVLPYLSEALPPGAPAKYGGARG